MTDSHEMKDIQRGSIIKTINGANKQETWSLVLGCMEDRDSVTCLRLTFDEEFKNIPSLKISSNIFGEGMNVYANPFSFLNIKIEWIKEVLDPIPQIEYFGVVSSIVNYFAGFFYKDEEGQLKMDMPYVQNPVFFMVNGMVTINQARNIELSTKIKMQERIEKKEKDEVDRKMNAIKPFSKKKVGQRTPQPKDVKKAFESLGVYTLDTQNRIEAIFKFFKNYLAAGEQISITMVYKIMFKGALLQKMQHSKSSVNQEGFAFVINNDATTIADKMGISIPFARMIKIQALCIFYGKESVTIKPASPNSDLYEKVRELYNNGMSLTKVRETLVKEYGLSAMEAKRVSINAKPTTYTYKTRTVNDQANKLLNIMEFKWFSKLIDANEVFDIVSSYSDKIGRVHDGSIIVNTGDPFIDAVILTAIYSSINSWKWFQFIFTDRYHYIAKAFNEMTINDILAHYTDNAMNHQTFYSSKMMLLKIISTFVCMSDEDKLYLKAVVTGAVKCDKEKVDPFLRAFIRISSNPIPKNMSKAIMESTGIPNIDVLFDMVIDDSTFTNLPDSDLIKVKLTGKPLLK